MFRKCTSLSEDRHNSGDIKTHTYAHYLKTLEGRVENKNKDTVRTETNLLSPRLDGWDLLF